VKGVSKDLWNLVRFRFSLVLSAKRDVSNVADWSCIFPPRSLCILSSSSSLPKSRIPTTSTMRMVSFLCPRSLVVSLLLDGWTPEWLKLIRSTYSVPLTIRCLAITAGRVLRLCEAAS
jgi:hypothetical protein